MNAYVCGLLAAASFVCGAPQAHADETDREVRFAILDHDTDIVGSSKEEGLDVGVELLSRPIGALHLIGSPRFVVGGLLNTEGQTNQVYAGLLAQWDFAEGVWGQDDAFYLEGTVGVTLHDGELDATGTPEDENVKSHGSNLLFRTGFGVGYRFNDDWSVTLDFAHISNANFAKPNQGSNDIGIRIGRRL